MTTSNTQKEVNIEVTATQILTDNDKAIIDTLEKEWSFSNMWITPWEDYWDGNMFFTPNDVEELGEEFCYQLINDELSPSDIVQFVNSMIDSDYVLDYTKLDNACAMFSNKRELVKAYIIDKQFDLVRNYIEV